MIKTDQRRIGKCEYRVTQLGFLEGRRAFLRLLKLAGPSLEGLGSAMNEAVAARKPGKKIAAAVGETIADAAAAASEASGATEGERAEKGAAALARVDVGKLGKALAAMIATLEDADLDWFVDVFGKRTMIKPDGQASFVPLDDQAEILFAGPGLADFARWAAFAVEVNYGGFFAGLVSADRGGRPPGQA